MERAYPQIETAPMQAGNTGNILWKRAAARVVFNTSISHKTGQRREAGTASTAPNGAAFRQNGTLRHAKRHISRCQTGHFARPSRPFRALFPTTKRCFLHLLGRYLGTNYCTDHLTSQLFSCLSAICDCTPIFALFAPMSGVARENANPRGFRTPIIKV